MQRHTFSLNERGLREQLAQATAARSEAEREATASAAQVEADVAALRAALDAKTAALQGRMAGKADEHNDAVRFMKASWEAEKGDLTARLEKLQAEVARQKTK
jgi:hypothetical protein